MRDTRSHGRRRRQTLDVGHCHRQPLKLEIGSAAQINPTEATLRSRDGPRGEPATTNAALPENQYKGRRTHQSLTKTETH